ncbi:21562_t:CDS:2 [Cetraspora pellucida]|uniref:21562_t:CDS:1 n=1 Tax=Cetraspora pellucida TaxID=1433469 RepID=A0A9N9B5N0_9GLOM|nr:21562_t:CDS:2 [Cetraspora pellucida]
MLIAKESLQEPVTNLLEKNIWIYEMKWMSLVENLADFWTQIK